MYSIHWRLLCIPIRPTMVLFDLGGRRYGWSGSGSEPKCEEEPNPSL